MENTQTTVINFQIPNASEIIMEREKYKIDLELQTQNEILDALEKIFRDCIKQIISKNTDRVMICCNEFYGFYCDPCFNEYCKLTFKQNSDYVVADDLGYELMNLELDRPELFKKIQENLRSKGYEIEYVYATQSLVELMRFVVLTKT